MRGTMLERKPGVWTLRVYMGRDGAGRPRQISRTHRGSRREAETELARFVAEVSDSRPAKDGLGASFGQLLDEWLKVGKQRGWTTYTEHRYSSSVECRVRPALGKIPLAKLDPADCDRFYASLLAAGLSPTTVRHHHNIVSGACDLAVDWGWIARNPASRSHPPSRTGAQTHAPTAEEVATIVKTAAEIDPVKAALVVLAAMTGARRGELCALRWSDIDWKKQTLTIARSLTVTPGKTVEGTTKTKRTRTISLGDIGISHLRAHHDCCVATARRVGSELSGKAFMFSSAADGSTPLLPDTVSRFHIRLMAKLGMNYRFHELRHFMATSMAASGVGIRTIAGRLGHADPSLTLRTYAHWLATADREAADIVEGSLGDAFGIVQQEPDARPDDSLSTPGAGG